VVAGSGELERVILREEHEMEAAMGPMALHEALRFVSEQAQSNALAVHGFLGMSSALQHPTVVAHVLHTLERMFDSTVG
jgi:hypothetical protein